LKIIFAGTPEFSVKALDALLHTEHDVIAVYTQPDRPFGRGRKLRPSPVKQMALDNEIQVIQPATLKDTEVQQQLHALEADVMVVVAYGLILPQQVLEAPHFGCLNIHASLLPRWRGAAPIQRAILAGDKTSGVTIMQMNAGLDTGDMLLKHECHIHPEDTTASLHDRLAEMGGRAIVEVIEQLEQGELKPVRQIDEQASYASKLDKAEARIDWSKSAQELDRQVRAFNPWPVAQTNWGDKVLRIWMSSVSDEGSDAEPGRVIGASKQGIDVTCGGGVLRLQQVQLPGGKPMPAHAFINAHDIDGQLLE